MKLAVIGAGAFGTAIANSLHKDNDILLYTRNQEIIDSISQRRKNEIYFPNKILSKKICATNDLNLVREASMLFLCIPSKATVDFVLSLGPIHADTIIVNGAKGFGKGHLLIPEAIAAERTNPVLVMKGPSFANEMIFEVPTAFTIGGGTEAVFQMVKGLFRDELMIFEHSNDIRGIELLSILKNIYSIIIGIVDASYNSSNVRFLIFTKALNEINAFMDLLGIEKATMYTYAGIGDFGLTSLNDLSRNRTLGLLIGKGFLGKSVNSSVVLEGMNSIKQMTQFLSKENESKFWLLISLNQLLAGTIDIKDFLNNVIYK